MRRSDREITDETRLNALLDSAHIVRVAMISEGEPYLVPLNFARLDKTLVFHSATEGRKVDAFMSGQKVCFEVEGRCQLEVGSDPCACTTRYESVIGWGTVAPVPVEEKSDALAALNRKHGASEGPFPEAMLEKVSVWALAIQIMAGKSNRKD